MLRKIRQAGSCWQAQHEMLLNIKACLLFHVGYIHFFRLIVMLVSPLDKPVLLYSSSSPMMLPRQLCKLSFHMCVSTPQADGLPNAIYLV